MGGRETAFDVLQVGKFPKEIIYACLTVNKSLNEHKGRFLPSSNNFAFYYKEITIYLNLSSSLHIENKTRRNTKVGVF